MNVLLYATETDGAGAQLQRAVEAVVPKKKTEVYRTIDGLSRRLRQPIYDVAVAVLFAATKKELSDILSIRGLLQDIRIILVLPDRDEETITKGHTLYPRFLTYADGDVLDVAAVLNKMVGNIHADHQFNQ
jgi:hypothetical protein